ncbi:MAG TPA: alpha/beta hydrolase [Noviherbaspirillum sp.]|uniref:esterase/lipase family protein n=1 Tax=Noviherbaspirillum sp. TaxID=1926288 RepID=UPI002B47D601|nr:alpha/beta hydrolase [Noviherbaspirillum sp.]HJV87680.1 alpha/beta hydrolase [Noviherbaspirillum sp.]
MKKERHIHPSDLRALASLATDATLGITDLVEAMHGSVLRGTSKQPRERTSGLTGLIYDAVRGVTRIAGNGIDTVLARLVPFFEERSSSPEREAVLAALNGVLGDYMADSGNVLAIRMALRKESHALLLEREHLRGAFPQAGGRLLILVHGLCMNDLQWQRQGHEHGAALARDLGYTPLYLHYNSGMHISTNGRELAALLQTLVQQWPYPLEEVSLLCHSLGGLVARSACHYAAQEQLSWLPMLRKLVFLGTPHHGAPLERVGNWVHTVLEATRYAAPFSRLGKIRSAGITDLRHGNLLDEDWKGRDRFARTDDLPQPVPLPEGVDCYALAVMLSKNGGEFSERVLGDGLVPLDSALGRHADPARCLAIPPERQWIGLGMGHLELLGSAEAYAQMRRWLARD